MKKERLKQMLEWSFKQLKPKCYFCNKDVNWKAIFPKYKVKDDWTIHHKDHNRGNNTSKNLVMSHRSCHRSYHRKLDEKHIIEEQQKLLNNLLIK